MTKVLLGSAAIIAKEIQDFVRVLFYVSLAIASNRPKITLSECDLAVVAAKPTVTLATEVEATVAVSFDPVVLVLPTLEGLPVPLPLVAEEPKEASLPVATLPDYTEATMSFLPEAASTVTFIHTFPQFGFINTQPEAELWRAPYLDFDGVLTNVPYGTPVTIRRFSGEYAEVVVPGRTGYVHKDAITTERTMIWPLLVSRIIYEADAPETLLLRKLIGDAFQAGKLQLPLQIGEYILFRLRQDSLAIPWPQYTTERVPGQWHQILRGVRGVHTSIMPLTDALMEWIDEDGAGKLAYVEGVLPDRTLRVAGVGISVPSEYSELVLPESVWREWRPVFIEVV